MDAKTGQVLFEKNLNEKKYPASITKVMTGMLALEKGDLTDTLTMSDEAVFSIGRNSSHIALDVEEELTLNNALYALAIASANDAANGIAEHLSGSLAAFAQSMTEKAGQVGAVNTNFVNAHGLPDDNHYTTAHDMAKIMMEAIKTPGFTEIFSEVHYEIPPTNNQPESRFLSSRNSILTCNAHDFIITASKSGWTSQANHTHITAAEQGDRKLIAVVLNNPSRAHNYEDTMQLLDYGFRMFQDIKFELTDLKTTMPEFNLSIADNQSPARLLHKDLTSDDLEKNYVFLENNDEAARIVLSLSVKKSQHYMHEDLGSIIIEAKKIYDTIPEIEIAAYAKSNTQKSNSIKIYLPVALGLICLYIIFVSVKRKNAIRRNRLNICQKYRY